MTRYDSYLVIMTTNESFWNILIDKRNVLLFDVMEGLCIDRLCL